MPVIQITGYPDVARVTNHADRAVRPIDAGSQQGVREQHDVGFGLEPIHHAVVVHESKAQKPTDLGHNVEEQARPGLVIGENNQLRRDPGHLPLLR
jgi:hypothetical protein